MKKSVNKKKGLIFLLLISIIVIVCLTHITPSNRSLDVSKEQNNNLVLEDNTNLDIFANYYEYAENMLKNMELKEKISQLFIIGNSNKTDYEELEKCQFGGYLFFKDFFKNKTAKQISKKIQEYQLNSKIPLAIAVDEEGGKVVRVSSNKNLRSTPFSSSSELYEKGGLEAIKKDTIEKSEFLSSLGINLNFAPVVDIVTNKNSFMYDRSLKQGKKIISEYAETVISTSKEEDVTYCLKHFPGYGNNDDTHESEVIDTRTYGDIFNNDLKPFKAGIDVDAEMIMISHNIVTSIDKENPASISKRIHEILRQDLNFSGIIITDAINMGAVKNKYSMRDSIIKALLAGNDMICLVMNNKIKDEITDEIVEYKDTIKYVIDAINEGIIDESMIDEAAKRVIAWKYYKGLLKK